ncbi:MAG: hypothetical protein AAF227_05715 [Pseudomonadota bacterium]
MSRYPIRRYVIHGEHFKRTRGELGTDDMSDAEFEAHTKSLTEEEQNDYIQEGVFGKMLSQFVQQGLIASGHEVIDNYADDWGRCVVIKSPGGKTVDIGCFNYADGTETEDGPEHMISVVGRPSLKGRFVTDNELCIFLNDVNAIVEKLVSETPHIRLLSQ